VKLKEKAKEEAKKVLKAAKNIEKYKINDG